MAQYDYNLEKRLYALSPDLSARYTQCVVVFEETLKKFLAVFPTYTDHSLLHSLNVLNYSNIMLGDEADGLNAQEIYCYMMAVALHDSGMLIPEKFFHDYIHLAGLETFVEEHPDMRHSEVTRRFHNDLSVVFIKKYYQVFDVPDESYADAIALIARGHRKVDLRDRTLYPENFTLADGSQIRLPVLAALLRVTDEMDLASDRNPELIYDMNFLDEIPKDSNFEFRKHNAVRSVCVEDGVIRITASTDEMDLREGLERMAAELREKLEYCTEIITNSSAIRLAADRVELIYI